MKREHTTKELLLSGYRQLEYIQATGTQYILTNITGYNEHWKWFFSIKFTSAGSITHGQYNQNANNDRLMSLITSNSTGFNRFDYACGGGYTTTSTFSPISDWCDIYEDYNHVEINGTSYSLTKHTKTSYKRLMFFAHYFGSTSWAYSHGKYRRVIVYDNNDNLILDGYPVLRIADSKPGLYGFVNNQFYTNAGSGEFLYA